MHATLKHFYAPRMDGRDGRLVGSVTCYRPCNIEIFKILLPMLGLIGPQAVTDPTRQSARQ